jgi:hypothetical protein
MRKHDTLLPMTTPVYTLSPAPAYNGPSYTGDARFSVFEENSTWVDVTNADVVDPYLEPKDSLLVVIVRGTDEGVYGPVVRTFDGRGWFLMAPVVPARTVTVDLSATLTVEADLSEADSDALRKAISKAVHYAIAGHVPAAIESQVYAAQPAWSSTPTAQVVRSNVEVTLP